MALTKKQLEYQRQWRKDHPEEYRAQQMRTRRSRHKKMANDIDFFIDQSYKSLKNGAKVRVIPFNISKKQLSNAIKAATHCSITGRKLTRDTNCPNRISIDRINNRYGYSAKNIQVVCAEANIHRLDSTLEDFIKLALDITKHQRKKNAKRKSR
jgi:hypothetical protein